MHLDQPIILDSGSSSTKVGFKSDSIPVDVFQTVIGYTEDLSSLRHSDLQIYDLEYYIGEKALSSKRVKRLLYPVWNLVIDWESIEKLWHYAFFDRLHVNPNYNPIMMVESFYSTREQQEKIAEIMFEVFCVPQLLLSKSPLLCLYAAGKITGVIVESSASMTIVVPIYKGTIIPHAITYSSIGGYSITKYLQKMLGNKYSQLKPKKFSHLIDELKKKHCYVSLNAEREKKVFMKTKKFNKEFILPSGDIGIMEEERFRAPELIFDPLLNGYNDEPIQNLILESIKKCDLTIRKELLDNLILCGGNTLLHGFRERLDKELNLLFEEKLGFKIKSFENREFFPWIGGRILCEYAEKTNLWLSRKKYLETGIDSAPFLSYFL